MAGGFLMKLTLIGSAMGALLAGASPGSANVTVTYSGTLTSGYDATGLFGTAGANLAGDAFTFQYVFDPTVGNTGSSAIWNYAFGGAYDGAASPISSAVVTIKGIGASIGLPSYFGEISGYDNSYFSEQYATAISSNGDGSYNFINSYIYDYTGSIPAATVGPLVYAAGLQDFWYAAFQIYAANNMSAAFGYGDVSTLIIVDPPGGFEGAPEPSTWAMLALGFAGLGLAGARARRRAASAA